MRIVFKGFSGD